MPSLCTVPIRWSVNGIRRPCSSLKPAPFITSTNGCRCGRRRQVWDIVDVPRKIYREAEGQTKVSQNASRDLANEDCELVMRKRLLRLAPLLSTIFTYSWFTSPSSKGGFSCGLVSIITNDRTDPLWLVLTTVSFHPINEANKYVWGETQITTLKLVTLEQFVCKI